MIAIPRRSLPVRAAPCPRCHQPWTRPRRSFTTSAPACNDAATPSSRTSDNRWRSAPRPSTGGFKSLRSRINRSPFDLPDRRVVFGTGSHLPIRARFAPSPTGDLHIGSLRTALFNKLAVSASTEGSMILRIEDTDQNRLVPGAERKLIEELRWSGITWDEGPDCGGRHGPYRQSERLSLYKTHTDALLRRGHAYRCFCNAQQLEEQHRRLSEAGKPTDYPGTCRSIPRQESDERCAKGEAHVVRFKADPKARPSFTDAIFGPFKKKDPETDFILVKSDGYPTYHFANVVDDHLMDITHVIRGEEWLISTPKHIALYDAFGWSPPTFAHLGLLVDKSGAKLSKRDTNVNLSQYRDQGHFPMALMIWLAQLGSSLPGKAAPPRSIQDLAEQLTFRFTRGGIQPNMEKLANINAKYRTQLLRANDPSESEVQLVVKLVLQPLIAIFEARIPPDATESKTTGPSWSREAALEAVPIMQNSDAERYRYILDIFASGSGESPSPETLVREHPYLFWRPSRAHYAHAASLKQHCDERIVASIRRVMDMDSLWQRTPAPAPPGKRMLDEASSNQGKAIMTAIKDELTSHGVRDVEERDLHNALRLLVVGNADATSLNSGRMLLLLGREELRVRMQQYQDVFFDAAEAPSTAS